MAKVQANLLSCPYYTSIAKEYALQGVYICKGDAIGKEVDFRIEISILFSYEAMTQGAHIGRLEVRCAGNLESKERNRS